jgi:hypothetical protein
MTNSSAIAASNGGDCERVVEDFVDKLRQVCGQATIDLALRVGLLVVETFYGGDVRRWRSRRREDPSLKCLAARSDLPLSLPQLYRCVAIYEISLELPTFSTWKYLSVSHVRAVLGLPRDAQQKLLSKAEQERWTVLRIEAEVRAVRGVLASKRGRPRRSEHERKLADLSNWLESCPDSFDASVAESIDPRHMAALQGRLRTVRNRLRHLHQMLKQRPLAASRCRGL